MRKTTIKDIAKKANVSIGTVSRALNSNGPVRPSTKEAVLKIAKELDYVPSTPEKGFFMHEACNVHCFNPILRKPSDSFVSVRLINPPI